MRPGSRLPKKVFGAIATFLAGSWPEAAARRVEAPGSRVTSRMTPIERHRPLSACLALCWRSPRRQPPRRIPRTDFRPSRRRPSWRATARVASPCARSAWTSRPGSTRILDEELYRTLPPITDFIQQDPDEGQLATEPTLVWILFDARNIYIAARCRDSQPSRIVANDMRRDGRNVSQNDNISVVLDTFHDRRNGYEFLMNSIGGAWDTQITDERDANRDWNTPWVPRSRQDAEGWTVEMAIPFRSLRYRGSGPQNWGINIRRNVRWKNELSYPEPGAAPVRGARDPEAVAGGHARGARGAALRAQPRRQAVRRRQRRRRPRDRSGVRERDRAERGLRPQIRGRAAHDGRLHLPDRLRAGRRRRPAGEPDALQPLLPGEAGLLPRRPGHLRVRRRTGGRDEQRGGRVGAAHEHAGPVLQPADRPERKPRGADRSGRAPDGKSRPLQHRAARHPDRRRVPRRARPRRTSPWCA